MKGKILPRTELTQPRTRLESVIPLQTPYVLMVDPASHCNFRCRFCPTGDHKLIRSTGRYQGAMDFALFQKIIDDLNHFPEPVRVLRLYKEGEPLLNPKLPEMIRCAKASAKVLRVDTTTNGALLCPERNRRLIDAGLDQINISVNGINSERFPELVGARIDFSRYVENLRDLYENRGQCEVYIKGIQENLCESEQRQFFDVFGDISDRIFLEHLSPAWPGYQFDQLAMKFSCGHYGQTIKERNVCPFIFYLMVVNSDGSVSLCVQDWSHQLIVGDLRNQSVSEVWNGAAINLHRVAHLEMKRKQNPICNVCKVISHGTLDDIDDFAPQLLKKIESAVKGQCTSPAPESVQ